MDKNDKETCIEERAKNALLRELSQEIWSKMVDVIASSPIDGHETDTDQAVRSAKFDAYGEIRDLVDSMITDKREYTMHKMYGCAVSNGPDCIAFKKVNEKEDKPND